MRKSTNDIAYAIVTETAKAMETAHGIIHDAEIAARAALKAKTMTSCRNCQAGLENFIIANETASDDEISDALHIIWQECPICRAEYTAYLADCAAKEAAEEQAKLDAWAAENEPEEHHELDKHAHNGDDERWQQGITR